MKSKTSLFLLSTTLVGLLSTSSLSGAKIHSIKVEGNNRVETPTILTYVPIHIGDDFDQEKIEDALKDLFATGLFADVFIEESGDTLLIKVVENKIINRIVFEGNDKIKDELLVGQIGLRPREVYTAGRAQGAAQKIRDIYRLSGRYGAKIEPKIIERDQNRVDLVFEIEEGKPTRIDRIIFVGNKRFSEGRLESIVMTKETRWYRFFTSDDTYDPDRMAYDRELLRKYYLNNGYADFKVVSVVAELDPDSQDFYITYTLDEGEPYEFGEVKIINNLAKFDASQLESEITFSQGNKYKLKEVEKTIENLNRAVGDQGFTFIEIEPKAEKDAEKHTVKMTFEIKEGRHVYINRINIRGNDRTNDNVVRREFRLGEGDAYNATKLNRSEQRIKDLGYFKKVELSEQEAGAPDKVDINVDVEDQATGQLQFAAGYSTSEGPLGAIMANERNVMGEGYIWNMRTMVSQRSVDARTAFFDPYFLDRRLLGGVEVFYTQRKYDTRKTFSDDYRMSSVGSSFQTGYEITESLRQNWNYLIREDHLGSFRRGLSPFVAAQSGDWLVSGFGHSLVYDKRDSRIDPTAGYYASVGNDFAGAGGNVRYIKNNFSVGHYLPIDDDNTWVLATKAETGIMNGLGKTTRVVDRYSLGGDSLRGFTDSGIGPRDRITRDALGGQYYYLATVELNFPLPLPNDFGVKGQLFTDIGSLWDSGNSSTRIVSNDSKTRVGSGVGITWKSPVGPIGITFAKAVRKVKGVDYTETFRVNFGTQF
ncbi:outer membrane protein assembly factor BamA [Candidatus Bealeia paramacronuclearis]|uniref:outer membrane protein assembly factor BamA n=1 Tax=Candidatus Bealeia paramacronuclearis TaxID=1921001 RepID=UPI002F265785